MASVHVRARSLAGPIARVHVWQGYHGSNPINGRDIPAFNPRKATDAECYSKATAAGYGAGRSGENALVGFLSFIRGSQNCQQQRAGGIEFSHGISPGRRQGFSLPLQNSTGAGVRGVFGSIFNSEKRRGTKKGFQIGNYVLGKKLGKGAFGMVRLAKNMVTNEEVAIKIISKKSRSQYKDQEMKERLMIEIAAMMAVRHPNIVRLHEVMGSQYHVYLAMEYLPGGTLFQKIKKPLSEDEARAYFHQLIDAMAFCHRKGVYHRDLKPENLLLDARGNLKVADFGLSGMTSVATMPGQLQAEFSSNVGTCYYMAPEVILAQSVTGVPYLGAPADIWACGVILFQLLCGVLPFMDEYSANGTLITMQEKIVRADYHVQYGISVPARKLIGRMLEPQSEARITATGIYNNYWFKVNYRPPDFREIQEVKASLEAVESAFNNQVATTGPESEPDWPMSMNAFHLLSQSVPVDLSTLVERSPGDTGAMEETRLTSRLPAPDIVRELQAAALSIGLRVQVKGFRMKLDAHVSSPKEPLSILGEVFELPESKMFMVILRKVTGDSVDCKRAFQMICYATRATMVEIKTR